MLIPLTKGQFAIVDAADYDDLAAFEWYYNESAGGYAARNVLVGPGNHRTIQLMHRWINRTPRGYCTDHINRNKLDNRRANLRTVTWQQNQRNREAMSANTSGCRGVSFDQARGRWAAYIKVNYRKIHLGRFATLDAAVNARLRAEEIYRV